MDKKKGRLAAVIVIAGAFLFLAAPVLFLKLSMKEEETVFGSSGFFREEEVRAVSEEIVRLFGSGFYGEILENYGAAGADTQQNLIRMESMAAGIGGEWGEHKETIFLRLWEVRLLGGCYASVQVKAVYEKAEVIFEFSFDEEMKLSGIELGEDRGSETADM